MNANELADELDASRLEPYTSEYLVGKAATMLRQFELAESIIKQQKLEIDALLRFIDVRGETGQFIIWKAQEK